MKKDDALRKKLAESFEDFEVEPQEKSWENIQAAIRPKRKRRPLLLILLGAAVASLFLGGAYWVFNPMQQVMSTNPDMSSSIKYAKCISTRRAIEVKNTYQTLAVNRTPKKKPLHRGERAFAAEQSPAKVLQPILPRTILISDSKPGPSSLDEVIEQGLPDTKVDTVARFGTIQVIDKSPVVIQSLETKNETFPEPVKIHQDKPSNKARWIVGLNILSTYQIMETQWINGLGAGDIMVTPAWDTRRLGAAWMVGYRMPLQKRSDIGVGLTWMNLPYRVDYTVRSSNQVTVELQSTSQYILQTSAQKIVSDERRLNWLGVQAEYGYTVKVFRKDMRFFAGTEALYSSETAKADFWLHTGLEFPFGQGKYSLCPVVKYQMGHIQQSDQLLKTRLYTLGLGVKRIF
jgi:hypothetical protein